MREPVIALAFTPEPWVEAMHRHFSDHGGARVRQLIIDPAAALDDDYEVLVTSARWPALTPGLVAELRNRHRAVLGVASRDDHGSVDVLTHAGVDRIVMSDAAPTEFIEALLLLVPDRPAPNLPPPVALEADVGNRIVVRGPAGAGATEVAIGVAAALARRSPVALIDLDDVAPSVAQRLGLPIEPNLRNAIDAVEYGVGEFVDNDPTPTSVDRTGLRVVAGIANAATWHHIRPTEADRVLRSLARSCEHVVVDVAAPLDEVGHPTRGRYSLARSAIGSADVLIAVGDATPVGMTRLVTWLAQAHELCGAIPVHGAFNRASRDRFRRAQLVDEFSRCYEPTSVAVVPDEAGVRAAMWNGAQATRATFGAEMRSLAARVVPIEVTRRTRLRPFAGAST